jgi:hypothetical protein
MDKNLETIWRFLRGDLPVAEFEQWVYDEKTLEATLGPDLHLDLISASFRSKESIFQIKAMLREFAAKRDQSTCRCIRTGNSDVVDMGEHEELFNSLEEIAVRGDPYWWLSAYRCRHCATTWLVAQEERQNDIFCFHRLSPSEAAMLSKGSWPTYFDQYETLLQIGLAAGKSVRFLDPINDSSLKDTIVDLARQRPDIRVSELATLLNLDAQTAITLAQQAKGEDKVKIEFDL